MVEVRFYDTVNDELLKFAVIIVVDLINYQNTDLLACL